jgi:osmotically-inducible protein OsmY
MTLQDRPSQSDLYAAIREVLMTRCGKTLARIRIDNDASGRVTIEGEVEDWVERQQVESAVASVPGVEHVDCRLVIDN